ncbi:MAG: glycosyltransferase family 4 protein, partial [Sulfuricurvum sp.]|uniref:glycosyltransferase family 4 protein n=1 Tax=Sulfuricurvum sp. TaxID=2025608 RepID=UPI0025DAFAEE
MNVIHQFTPSVAYGDGVTGGLFFTQTLLRRFGFTSEIYAHHIDPRLATKVHPLSAYLPCADQTLLFHHSIGHEHDALILSWPDRLILVYHNITPEHFFADSPHLAAACTWGRDQLKRWPRNRFLGAYADSDYNRDELIRLGYRDVRTIPLLVDLSRFDTPSPSVFTPPKGDPFTILFVGRMVENKCQDQLIDVLDELILRKVTNIRLVLVGGISSVPYQNALQSKIAALGLSNVVLLAGKVSDEELRRWYVTADLYLSLSEHEGFGMPLLEAMAHDLPVLAYDAGALITTLPASSLLLFKAPGRIAEKIIEIMGNPAFRRDMILSQRDHLHRFHPLSLAQELADFLKQCAITIPNVPRTPYPVILNPMNEDTLLIPYLIRDPSPAFRNTGIRIDGPCDSTYSLALVNRELGRALMEQGRELSFFATEGPGDYRPDREFLAGDPQILESLSDYPLHAHTVIRNLYPPRV